MTLTQLDNISQRCFYFFIKILLEQIIDYVVKSSINFPTAMQLNNNSHG